MHKALGGKSGEPALQKAGYFRLIDLQNTGRARLGEAAGTNCFGDANGEVGFCEALFWLRQADIGEYIAAISFKSNALSLSGRLLPEQQA